MKPCFGLISAFSYESEYCNQCPHFAECKDEVIKTACAIEKGIDISPILKKHLELKDKFPKTKDLEIKLNYAPKTKVKMAKDTKEFCELSLEDQSKLIGLTREAKKLGAKLLIAKATSKEEFLNLETQEVLKAEKSTKFALITALLIGKGVNAPSQLKETLRRADNKISDSAFNTKFRNTLKALKAIGAIKGLHRYELISKEQNELQNRN